MTAEPTQALCAVAIGPDLPQFESLAACRAGPPRMRSSQCCSHGEIEARRMSLRDC